MIPVYTPWLTDLEEQYAIDAIKSGWISSIGSYVPKVETGFSEFVGSKHSISVNTGTAACHLALAATNIGPGDEVIVPALTFIATANAVSYCGAKPVIVDVDEDTWNIDCDEVEKAITPNTKAIMIVHLYGNPCNMDRLKTICNRHNLILVEDACEAIGAFYRTKHVGSIGDIGCFSFYGNKTITTGEGGMVVTNNDKIEEMARILRGQGQTAQYYHSYIGFNYRMTNVCAAIGCAQLERMNEIIKEKHRVYRRYQDNLSDIAAFASVLPNASHGHWMVTIRIANKEAIVEALKEKGVDSRPAFYPLPEMPPYKDHPSCKIADKIYSDGLSLPSYPTLSNEEIDNICQIVRSK